jgi:hypothetical protein
MINIPIINIMNNSIKEKSTNGWVYFQPAISKGQMILLILFILVTATACNKNDKPPATSEVKLQQVMEALGGLEAINNVQTISYAVKGSTFEWEQPKPTEANPLNGSNYLYNYTSELNKRKVRFDYNNINYNHPFPYNTNNGQIIINDKNATISGQYNWLSYYFGLTQPTALYPSRLEAILKNQKMANPIELVKDVLSNHGATVTSKGNKFSIPTRIPNLEIQLEIDPLTNLPKNAKIMEEDYLNGDVVFEIVYGNWVNASNIKYPSKLIFNLNNQMIKVENLSNIRLNPSLESNHFNLKEAVPIAYSEQNANMGIYFSQWHHRWIGWGILIDQPLDNGALVLEKHDLSSFKLLNQTVGPNLKIIGRPDLRTWSIALKTNEGLIVVEAPLNTFWTRSCIKAIKNEFPGEKIIAAISTHNHHVTFGGIRELAQEAGKIYVGAPGADFAKKVLNSKHTLVPDALSQNPREITVEPVTGVTSLANGAVEIHLLKTSDPIGTPESGPHSEDMLIIYVPEYEAVIQADHFWSGEYMRIWNGETQHNYTPKGRAELKRVARYLLDYINEKKLKVSRVIGIHGGVGTLDELKEVAKPGS